MTDRVDVLVIGAGPAGLMASLYLAELGISHRIIDKRGTRALNGRADGFQLRTLEIWDSFGILNSVKRYGSTFGEFSVWIPAAGGSGGVKRVRQQRAGGSASKFHPLTFHQGFVEASLISAIIHRGGPSVERALLPEFLEIRETECSGPDAYPLTVHLRHLQEVELQPWGINAHSISTDGRIVDERGSIDAFGTDPEDITPRLSGPENSIETIHAKYIIGADGAHSWVRHQLPGFTMEGASTNSIWGVIDVVPITDFPDVRRLCTIMSEKGTALIIPREHDFVRVYIQLPDNDSDLAGRSDSTIVSRLVSTIQDVLQPYRFTYTYCDWWTVYSVGQRICTNFAYPTPKLSDNARIFLAGDAVHTHTPKGGQGMNVSQQDSYNLAWKLAGVLNRQLQPSVLSTYESERRPVGQELVALDLDLSRILTARSQVEDSEVRRVYDRLRANSSGENVCYSPSSIVADKGEIFEARKLKLGMRLPDVVVWSQSHGNITDVQTLLNSDGRWRLCVFAGDTSNAQQLEHVNKAGEALSKLRGKYWPAFGKRQINDSVPIPRRRQRDWFQILLFHAGKVDDIEMTSLHESFFPYDEQLGHDYNTIFANQPSHALEDDKNNTRGGTGIYDAYGVSQDTGAMILIRPDQIIAWVGGLGDSENLSIWLQGCMLPKTA